MMKWLHFHLTGVVAISTSVMSSTQDSSSVEVQMLITDNYHNAIADGSRILTVQRPADPVQFTLPDKNDLADEPAIEPAGLRLPKDTTRITIAGSDQSFTRAALEGRSLADLVDLSSRLYASFGSVVLYVDVQHSIRWKSFGLERDGEAGFEGVVREYTGDIYSKKFVDIFHPDSIVEEEDVYEWRTITYIQLPGEQPKLFLPWRAAEGKPLSAAQYNKIAEHLKADEEIKTWSFSHVKVIVDGLERPTQGKIDFNKPLLISDERIEPLIAFFGEEVWYKIENPSDRPSVETGAASTRQPDVYRALSVPYFQKIQVGDQSYSLEDVVQAGDGICSLKSLGELLLPLITDSLSMQHPLEISITSAPADAEIPDCLLSFTQKKQKLQQKAEQKRMQREIERNKIAHERSQRRAAEDAKRKAKSDAFDAEIQRMKEKAREEDAKFRQTEKLLNEARSRMMENAAGTQCPRGTQNEPSVEQDSQSGLTTNTKTGAKIAAGCTAVGCAAYGLYCLFK